MNMAYFVWVKYQNEWMVAGVDDDGNYWIPAYEQDLSCNDMQEIGTVVRRDS